MMRDDGCPAGGTLSATGTYDCSSTAAESEGPREFIFKVVVAGEHGAGKTSLLTRLISPEKNEEDDNKNNTNDGGDISPFGSVAPTVGTDFFSRVVRTAAGGGHHVRLQFWDTAGRERFAAPPATTFRNASAVILVFDVTDRRSFEKIFTTHIVNIFKYNKEVTQQKIFVVANKIDLWPTSAAATENSDNLNSDKKRDEKNVLTSSEINEKLLSVLPNVHYHEISAVQNNGVGELLHSLCTSLLSMVLLADDDDDDDVKTKKEEEKEEEGEKSDENCEFNEKRKNEKIKKITTTTTATTTKTKTKTAAGQSYLTKAQAASALLKCADEFLMTPKVSINSTLAYNSEKMCSLQDNADSHLSNNSTIKESSATLTKCANNNNYNDSDVGKKNNSNSNSNSGNMSYLPLLIAKPNGEKEKEIQEMNSALLEGSVTNKDVPSERMGSVRASNHDSCLFSPRDSQENNMCTNKLLQQLVQLRQSLNSDLISSSFREGNKEHTSKEEDEEEMEEEIKGKKKRKTKEDIKLSDVSDVDSRDFQRRVEETFKKIEANAWEKYAFENVENNTKKQKREKEKKSKVKFCCCCD